MGNQSNRALLSDYLLGQQSSSFGRNYVLNPSGFENVNNISISGSATITRNTATPLTAISDLSVSLPNDTSSGVTWTLNTLDNSLNGQNCMLSFDYTSSSLGSAVQAQVLQGSNISATVTLNPASTPKNVILNTPCGNLGSATTVVITNVTGNSGSSALHVANVNYGKATNIGTVAQAQLIGQVTITGCSADWSTASTSFSSYSAESGCTYTASGQALSDSSGIPEIKFSSLPPGKYVLHGEGRFYAFTNSTNANPKSYYQFSDGTNTAPETSTVGADFSAGASAIGASAPGIEQTIVYTSSQLNVTFSILGKSDTSSVNSQISTPLVISVYYYPTQGQLAVNSNQLSAPQTTVLTSGSGTYAVPNGVTYLEVKMCGGGGGGGPGGYTPSWTGGGTGGDSTFGSSCLLAGGGGGGTHSVSASPGSASLGSCGAVGLSIAGSYGEQTNNNFGSGGPNGGNGSGSIFSSPGMGSESNVNGQDASGYGSGGGGGGGSTTAVSGGGGSSAGCVNAFISNPLSSYAYVVGAAGSAGTSAGTNGGSGAPGIIMVTASFSNNTPILIGSVTSSGSGQYHNEAASLTVTANTGTNWSIVSQTGSWISSVSTGTKGISTLTIAANEFSSAPICTVSSAATGSGEAIIADVSSASTTSVTVHTTDATGNDYSFPLSIICMGPH